MNKFDFIIRKETEKDYREVENLAREAFWNLSVPGCFEHYFIHIMRGHSDFVRELDYVAETDGRIVGSVMYSKLSSGTSRAMKRISSPWDLSAYCPSISAGASARLCWSTPLPRLRKWDTTWS